MGLMMYDHCGRCRRQSQFVADDHGVFCCISCGLPHASENGHGDFVAPAPQSDRANTWLVFVAGLALGIVLGATVGEALRPAPDQPKVKVRVLQPVAPGWEVQP